MLLSLFYISFGSLKSMILKTIWLLTLSVIICYTIPTIIWSFFISFAHNIGFLHEKRGLINTRSYTSFFISIDLVNIAHIGQFIKLVNFLHLVWPLLLLADSSGMFCLEGREGICEVSRGLVGLGEVEG